MASVETEHLSLPSVPTGDAIEEVYVAPASLAQQRLWILDQLDSSRAAFNCTQFVRLAGPLDVKAIEKAIDEIVRRHDILRTTFDLENEELVQVVALHRGFRLSLLDLSHWPASERGREAERAAFELAAGQFNLNRGPLMRVALIRLATDDHRFVVVKHHIINDGWSDVVFLHEFESLYEAYAGRRPAALADLPIQYSDYAIWQRNWLREQKFERQLAYWKECLKDVPSLELPTDRPRPTTFSYRGAVCSQVIDKRWLELLRQLCFQERTTLFTVLLAAFQILLYRYSGQRDIVVGTPIANRNHYEVEGLIGVFLNMLALRGEVAAELNFRDYLRQVRQRCLDAFANQDVPIEKLIEELNPKRDLARHPLFQVLFVLQSMPDKEPHFAGLEAQILERPVVAAKYDILLEITETSQGMLLLMEYCTDLFEAATVRRMLQHYETLLESIAANPDCAIFELRMLTPKEEQGIRDRCNETKPDFPKEGAIHELFDQSTRRSPDAIALVCGDEQVSYAELHRRTQRVASYLKRRGVGPESLVAICLERSVDLVVGIIGVLKAGGAYVPLDPTNPPERLTFILDDTQPALVITQHSLAGRFPAAELVCLDRDWPEILREPFTVLPSAAVGQNLAYVIYTSGSTGRPKGVALTHRNAAALLSWSKDVFSSEELAGTLASTSVCFDLSVFELFLPLCCGGTVILANNVLELPRLAAANAVTLVNTVPSAMTELLRSAGLPSSVRTVNLAGEPLKKGLVDQLYCQPSIQRVFDLYGPSEDTTYSTFALRRQQGPETIGRPISNTRLYVLDRHGFPVPDGVVGEIQLCGEGLARGYWNRPTLTAEKFIPDPWGTPGSRRYRTGDLGRFIEEGNVEFHGRADQQVKIRGFRIELGEIEAVLLEHPSIADAVVGVHEEPATGQRLVAYLIGVGPQAVTIAGLRSYLSHRLPHYMIPAAFVWCDDYPRTTSGKVDRRALVGRDKLAMRPANDFLAPRTTTESEIARIWKDLLGVERVGVTDDFFELGGHSLLVLRLLDRIQQTFGRAIPVNEVFQRTTVEQLALTLDPSSTTHGDRSVSASPPEIPLVCLDLETVIGRHIGPERPVFALSSLRQLKEDEARGKLSIPEMAKRCIDELQTIRPHGPYILSGFCTTAIVAFEMAQQLRGRGDEVLLLILIDPSWPWLVDARQRSSNHIRKRLPHHLRQLRQRGPAAAARYVAGRVKSLFKLVFFPATTMNAPLAELRHTADFILQAARRYEPGGYAGRVALFWCRDWLEKDTVGDLSRSVQKFATGHVETQIIPGSHHTIYHEPHVQQLMAGLRDALAAVSSESRPGSLVANSIGDASKSSKGHALV